MSNKNKAGNSSKVSKKVKQIPVEEEDVLDISILPIRHSIYGLYAYINDSGDQLSLTDKKGFIYDLKEYIGKWKTINEKKSDELTESEYSNAIQSFIQKIMTEPLVEKKELNPSVFRLLLDGDKAAVVITSMFTDLNNS
jgi:hypothetical protein